MKIYALYKGDQLLATGTIIQIAYKMGVKPRTIKFYGTPTWKKRMKRKDCRELIEIEGD